MQIKAFRLRRAFQNFTQHNSRIHREANNELQSEQTNLEISPVAQLQTNFSESF